MAKHCTICDQDYADDLAACPHCASAKKTQMAGRSEDRTTQLAGRREDRTTQLDDESKQFPEAAAGPADSAIDFGLPPASKPATGDAGDEPISGASAVAWSSLVEEPGTEESKDIKIDSPSDADLLKQETAESPPQTPAGSEEELVGELEAEEPAIEATEADADAEVVDLSSAPPEPREQPSSSAVDLGGSPAEIVEDDSGAVVQEKASDESEVFMAELASDASKVDLVSDSGVNLSEGEAVGEVGSAEVVEEAAAADLSEEAALDAVEESHESSAVDLGGAPIVHEESLSAEEVGEVAEVTDGSGIDLEGLPVPAASASGLRPGSESSVDLGSHAEISASAPSEEGSEAIAESGIDLDSQGEPTASEAASDLDLESLTSDSASSEPPGEEEETIDEEAVVEEESVAAAEEGGVGEETMNEESAVSEEEVNDLLAGLEEPPAESASEAASGESAEIAEGEEEGAAEMEAEAEEEKKPAKPAKQRSRVPALVGGTFLGMLIGAGGMFGVQTLMGGGEQEKPPAAMSASTQMQAAPTFEMQAARVASGDWDEAKAAGIEQVPGADATQLVTRGEYHLGSYLQNVGSIKNPQDPALQPALQDLQKAAEQGNADAVYDLAFIKELAGQLPQARAEYVKGAQQFQNDTKQKPRFEAAIERVDWKATVKGGEAMLLLPERLEDRAAALAVLLVALQQQPQVPQPGPQGQPPGPAGPQGQPPAAEKEDTKEAGFEFWQAAKLAREGKFAEAIRSLDDARKLHDERRFKRLRKAQNPLSDPAEDIFLRCCDELKVYWRLENRLRDGGYLTDKKSSPEALQALIQKADEGEALRKDVTTKLVTAKVIGKDDNVSKGIDQLLTDKKKADDAVVDLETKLKKATDENTKLAGDLKVEKKKSEKLGTDLTSAMDEIKKLTGDNGELNATLKKITADLAKAKFLEPGDSKAKPKVGEAVKKAIDVAKTKDPQGMIRQQRDAIAQLTASLKQRWQPEEMLPLWLLLLDENRSRSELMRQAAMDVDRVKMDPKATSTQKGEAEVVLGLALRNAEKFDEAKKVLETAKGTVDKGEWLVRADAALKEVSNPAAYFAQQAQELYEHGQMEAALAVLERAMKALPEKEQGKLLAQRSLIELDAARSKAKGTLPANDPLIVAARKDAAEAVKTGLAEGHYAAGRIAEVLGQVDAAIKSYREALKVHGDKIDADGARYRMALARALLMPRQPRPGQATPAGENVGWRDPAPYPARHFDDVKRAVLMLTFGLQAPLLPGEEPGFDEAEKLADAVLKAAKDAPGSVDFNEVAQALAVKGRWSEALQTYVEGIRPMLLPKYREGLVYLIRNDPRLKRPDILRIPNPMEAERYFAAGLNFYFAREYANAEQAFLHSVENDSQDARYFYFLGLSKLAQNRRRDAGADFEAGAMLERVNRPVPATVSESMERIQGPTRLFLNEFRERP